MLQKANQNLPINDVGIHRTQMQKEIILQKLKERGCRITRQRKMLLDVILNEDCSSCKEIYYKASMKDSGIGTATVYRMINILEEIGALSRKNMYKIACGPAVVLYISLQTFLDAFLYNALVFYVVFLILYFLP